MTARIVIVGSFNMDLTTYMDKMPRPGETVMGDRFVTGPGGKGSNQAAAAARLGADVTFVGRVGDDEFGHTALKTWQSEGINTDYVVVDPDTATGVAPIFVDASGENAIVVALGANLTITTADIDAAVDVIAAADVVITQLEIMPEIGQYALRLAHEKGVRTILNPAPAAPISADFVALADFITPNETELQSLAGTDASPEDAARALIKRDDQVIVVTLGKQGAQWVSRDDTGTAGTYPVEVVDTTGAGDAFNGGLAVAIAEGKSLDDALAFANAVAALCVTKPGTAPSMPSRAEVDAFLAQQG